MADNSDKVEGNAEGEFYVDTNCIDCDLCRQTAPDNFGHNEDDGYSYVIKQPESEDERQVCKDAIDECPVDAIGDDG